MKVLRIEHMSVMSPDDERTLGPYSYYSYCELEHGSLYYLEDPCENPRCIHSFVRALSDFSADAGHPAPEEDPALADYTDDMFFGFSTVKQFHHWFDGMIKPMSSHGFVLAVYEVPNKYVIEGARQTVFVMDKATRLGDVDPRGRRGLDKLF